jgi:hypothetical protein
LISFWKSFLEPFKTLSQSSFFPSGASKYFCFWSICLTSDVHDFRCCHTKYIIIAIVSILNGIFHLSPNTKMPFCQNICLSQQKIYSNFQQENVWLGNVVAICFSCMLLCYCSLNQTYGTRTQTIPADENIFLNEMQHKSLNETYFEFGMECFVPSSTVLLFVWFILHYTSASASKYPLHCSYINER